MKTRVLIVDDEESIRSLLSQVLSEDGHEVTMAREGEEGLEVFRREPFPLVITDIKMPGMTGIELLEKIKEMRPETQVLIITSHASLDTAVTALRHGAYDYMVKPFDDIELISASVGRAVEQIGLIEENRRLIGELMEKNEELERTNIILKNLSTRDSLTGLYNHRHFQEALQKEIVRSRRHEKELAVVFLDVDHFKDYNDINGHPQGDELLRVLGRLLGERVRETDFVARYGGEEFVIVLPETSREKAVSVANDIRKLVAEYPFLNREQQPLGMVTVSIGVACFPEDGREPSEIIQAADQAQYQAKRDGRNLVVEQWTSRS